jgi:uncharacterized membrane protein
MSAVKTEFSLHSFATPLFVNALICLVFGLFWGSLMMMLHDLPAERAVADGLRFGLFMWLTTGIALSVVIAIVKSVALPTADPELIRAALSDILKKNRYAILDDEEGEFQIGARYQPRRLMARILFSDGGARLMASVIMFPMIHKPLLKELELRNWGESDG